jgi:hypothetical protein
MSIWNVEYGVLHAKKKYDERASLEEERKGERTHRLPQIIEPSRA